MCVPTVPLWLSHLVSDPSIYFLNLGVELKDVLRFLKATGVTLGIQHQAGPALRQVVQLVLDLC